MNKHTLLETILFRFLKEKNMYLLYIKVFNIFKLNGKEIYYSHMLYTETPLHMIAYVLNEVRYKLDNDEYIQFYNFCVDIKNNNEFNEVMTRHVMNDIPSFLNKNLVMNLFNENLINFGKAKTLYEYINKFIRKHRPVSYFFILAFPWHSTPQRSNFWSSIDRKFLIYLGNKYDKKLY